MKLRIRENTLRIRLTKSELERIGADNYIESSIQFPNGTRLTYGLQHEDITDTRIEYRNNEIQIAISNLDLQTLLEEANVGIQSIHTTDTGTLDLLIEKDFTCLHPRGVEDADTFPNPNRKENT